MACFLDEEEEEARADSLFLWATDNGVDVELARTVVYGKPDKVQLDEFWHRAMPAEEATPHPVQCGHCFDLGGCMYCQPD